MVEIKLLLFWGSAHSLAFLVAPIPHMCNHTVDQVHTNLNIRVTTHAYQRREMRSTSGEHDMNSPRKKKKRNFCPKKAWKNYCIHMWIQKQHFWKLLNQRGHDIGRRARPSNVIIVSSIFYAQSLHLCHAGWAGCVRRDTKTHWEWIHSVGNESNMNETSRKRKRKKNCNTLQWEHVTIINRKLICHIEEDLLALPWTLLLTDQSFVLIVVLRACSNTIIYWECFSAQRIPGHRMPVRTYECSAQLGLRLWPHIPFVTHFQPLPMDAWARTCSHYPAASRFGHVPQPFSNCAAVLMPGNKNWLSTSRNGLVLST